MATLPSPQPLRYAWLVVALLLPVALLNYLDRQMMAAMKFSVMAGIPDLKTDEQWGIMLGQFKWVYAFLSPIGGLIADRFSRRFTICASLFVWSGVTYWTGQVRTYEELLLARSLMGVSEAFYIPAGLALIAAGRVKPIKPLAGTVAFHDSCYLGRYNGLLDAPREVARAVPGLRVVDPPRSRERGLCCGGGGGHMWMEVPSKKRVNVIRTEELLETGATIVGTACPFCLAMVDLGRKVKEAEERLAVKDVSELVAESLE